jgi:uncharacterized protein YjbI with pentapeptide repeats
MEKVMANEKHLKVLKRGVDEWNEWRSKNKDEIPDLSSADLSDANLRYADLSHANLSDANLSRADLSHANLSRADLSRTILHGAHIRDTNLISANLSRANLRSADLSHANLSCANLRSADLSSANLSRTDLSHANLSHADLSHSNLSSANFSHANLSSAELKMSTLIYTVFGNTDLEDARNLDSCRHSGPSIIDQMTLMKSGSLPDVFLKGCGLTAEFIQYIPSLLQEKEPFQFYTYFISYSGKDEDFAKRLYADLQNEGVRCWFAPEDIKIGDKIRSIIDESIRIYDKLLLILSENSINSTWVEKEVETAFEKENQNKHTVLFPIRLDNGVMDTGTAWAADIRRTRNIGDFANWKDHDAYKQAFERLMRDLKAL